MPVITNEELRLRLEAHNYNVPPITELTKNVLIRKLQQLDNERLKHNRNGPSRNKLMEYSSAEEDASNTPKLRRKKQPTNVEKRTSKRFSNNGNNGHSSEHAPTFKKPVAIKNGKSSEQAATTKKPSLVQFSEDDEEDNSDDSENESNEDEEEADVDRNDFAAQTSFASPTSSANNSTASRLSDNGATTSTPSDLRQRRNLRFSSSTPIGPIRSTSAYLSSSGSPKSPPSCSPLAFPANSPLRRAVAKNKEAFGSLGEALASLPSSSTVQTSSSMNNSSMADTAVLSQVSRTSDVSSDHNNFNRLHSRRKTTLDYVSVSKIIITFAITFFGFLMYKYCNLRPRLDIENKLTICDASSTTDGNCVDADMVQPFMDFFQKAVFQLENHSMNQVCYTNDTYVGLELSSLESMVLDNDSSFDGYPTKQFITYMAKILEQHPYYGIGVHQETETSPIILRFPYPQVGWMCWFSITFYALMSYAKIAFIGFSIIAVVACLSYFIYRLYKWRCEVVLREQQDVFELVEQVLSLLMKHHQHQTMQERTRRNASRTGVAVNHIRDQLIPPQERKRKFKIWNKVVKYIRESESRVREDIQAIYGEEHKVWQWIPDVQWCPLSHPGPNPYVAPLHMGHHSQPSTPFSTSTTPALSKLPLQSTPKSLAPSTPSMTVSPSSSRWQGSATRNLGAPFVAPTSCLKVRHLFDDNLKTKGGANWVRNVIDEVLIRCTDANIFHIAVDTQSTEGCVYIKAKSTDDASKVFKTLHGQWYRGNLVTAKYLRDERYIEKFPDSKFHQTPMQPGHEVSISSR